MAKEVELAKKLAVLGWIYRSGLISDDEYNKTKRRIMHEYGVLSFFRE